MSHEISVVIPFHRGGKTVGRALGSVLLQSVRVSEVCIILDGPQPQADFEVLRGLSAQSPDTIVLVTSLLGGQSHSRNLGASLALSDTVAFLDQDDYWIPEHIESCLEVMQASGADLVFSEAHRVFEIGRKPKCIERYTASRRLNPDLSISGVPLNYHIVPSAMVVRGEFFRDVGGFCGELRGFEDDDLVARSLLTGVLRPTNQSSVRWTFSPTSASRGKSMRTSFLIYCSKIFTEHWSNLSRSSQRKVLRLLILYSLYYSILAPPSERMEFQLNSLALIEQMLAPVSRLYFRRALAGSGFERLVCGFFILSFNIWTTRVNLVSITEPALYLLSKMAKEASCRGDGH